ncbi:hypothetical protein BH09PLA1_BH09PLA1_11030 [soil metagenome]
MLKPSSGPMTLIALAVLAGVNSTASADVLISNLAEPYRAATPITNPQYWGAQSFYVDAQAYSLSWIEALVGEAVDAPDVIAELRSADVNGQIDQSPAGLLTAFIPPDVTGARSARVFTPVSAVTLAPSTQYWFIMGCSNQGVFDWGYADTGLWNGPGAFGNYADSSTGGGEWDYRSNDFPYFLRVNVNESGLEWNLDGNGDWSVPGNWLGGAPNAFGAVANFGSVITDDRTVTVDSNQTVGQINFNNEHRYTTAGPGVLTLDGSPGLVSINVLSGSHDITAPLTLAADTAIDVAAPDSTLTLLNLAPSSVAITKSGAGQLAIHSLQADTLHVDGGTVRILLDGGSGATTHLRVLTILGGATPAATLDLEDNDLIVTGSGYGMIRTLIRNARNGGAWDQPGITSSAAAAATPKNKTLGTLRGSQYLSTGATTFDGFPVAGNDILVKFTYYGDTDFNGVVNFDDYSRIDSGFNSGATDWFHGDFDYNNLVNFDDYSLIDLAFNTQSGTLRRAMSYLDGTDRSESGMTSPALKIVQTHFDRFGEAYATSFLNAVPEPTVGIAGLAALATMRRRRRI